MLLYIKHPLAPARPVSLMLSSTLLLLIISRSATWLGRDQQHQLKQKDRQELPSSLGPPSNLHTGNFDTSTTQGSTRDQLVTFDKIAILWPKFL